MRFEQMLKQFIPEDKWEYTGLDKHIDIIVKKELAEQLADYK